MLNVASSAWVVFYAYFTLPSAGASSVGMNVSVDVIERYCNHVEMSRRKTPYLFYQLIF